MGWAAFVVTLVSAAVLGVIYKRRTDEALDALHAESREQVTDLKREAKRRVERLEREAGRSRNTARDKLLDDLLPALDSLALARDSTDDPDVRHGLDLAIGEFERALAGHDIEPIEPQPGASFDPTRHEAVETVETDEHPPGVVARCHRGGWKSSDRVLRPAMVGVARAAEVVLDHGDDEGEPADQEVVEAEPEVVK